MAKNENPAVTTTPISVMPEPEQPQLFEGYEVNRTRFTLRVGPDLDTDAPLHYGERVSGQFSGIVTEIALKLKRDGNNIGVFVIEVDEADLS